MNRRPLAWAVLAVGLFVTLLGMAWAYQQGNAPTQPWSELLHDNVMFARMLPFLVGIGLVLGAAQALLAPAAGVEMRRGWIRRFAPSTVTAHWINALGFLIALGTGAVQYLSGLLHHPPPVPLWQVYRLHYVGASLMVLIATTWVTQRLLTAEYRLLPRGSWARQFRGLAAELPGPLGATVLYVMGLKPGRAAPPAGEFTYYEKLVDFPFWVILLALILASGLLKAMRYLYPLPGEVVHVASVVHVVAMGLLALKLLDHLRYVLTPSRWPLLRAMITTWIDADYVRRHLPGWYADVQASSPGASALEPEAAPPVPPNLTHGQRTLVQPWLLAHTRRWGPRGDGRRALG